MKRVLLCFLLIVSLVVIPQEIATAQNLQPATTVMVVRHAEKASNTGDTPLSDLGKKRAETLARMLSQSGVSAVFSTDTLRAIQTAKNYAEKKNIEPEFYTSEISLCNEIKSQHLGESVLVVGHSNTVPKILEACGVQSPPSIDDEYNNLFVVTIPSTGASSLTHLKFEIQSDLM